LLVLATVLIVGCKKDSFTEFYEQMVPQQTYVALYNQTLSDCESYNQCLIGMDELYKFNRTTVPRNCSEHLRTYTQMLRTEQNRHYGNVSLLFYSDLCGEYTSQCMHWRECLYDYTNFGTEQAELSPPDDFGPKCSDCTLGRFKLE
jgi:hypothetical protein